MNPTKSSLLIFLIIAEICILSILASPSVPRRQEATSTTASPVDNEDAPESDQLTLRKRNVPANDQEEGTTTQQTPPSDQWDVPEHLRQNGHEQQPSGPDSDQLTLRKRNVPANDQEEGTTTQQTPPSDQWLFANRRKRQVLALGQASSTTQDPLAAGPPPSDQLIGCPHCGGFDRRRRQVPPRLRGQEASSTTQDPFAAAGPPSDQIAAPIEGRRKRQVPPRSPLRRQGATSTTQTPPRVGGPPPSADQLTKRSAVAIQKRSPQYNMMAPPPQAWPVMPMPWQQPPPPQMGWPGPVPPPMGGEWPGGQPSPAVSGGMWPVPPPWPQQPAVAKA